MKFSQVMYHLENGGLIARHRWNKTAATREDICCVFMETSYTVDAPQALAESGALPEITEFVVLNHPLKKNRGNRLTIWTPAPEDISARDWYVVNFNNSDWEQVRGNFRKQYEKNDESENNGSE